MQLDGIKRRVRWSAYIAQIRFHEEIIRFALLGFRCIFKHATWKDLPCLCGFYSFARKTSTILSGIIFMHLFCCASIIAFNLILLEYSTQFDLQLIACLYIMLSETAANFMFCFLSENISTAMTSVSDIFYESMWYYLPACQQKMIILPIVGSQQDFQLDGFGLISCSLSTFWQVICSLPELKIKS